MVNNIRDDVREVLEWQRAVLERLDAMEPPPEGVVTVDFIPDALMDLNGSTFRQFVEASIAKLSIIID